MVSVDNGPVGALTAPAVVTTRELLVGLGGWELLVAAVTEGAQLGCEDPPSSVLLGVARARWFSMLTARVTFWKPGSRKFKFGMPR